MTTHVVMTFGCLAIVAAASMNAFGFLSGAGIVCGVWLLMPVVR